MNKIILSLLLTTALTSAANAQNCVNSSRCDELGYTKTAADCTGLDTLTCPFDKNKFFCTAGTGDAIDSCSAFKSAIQNENAIIKIATDLNCSKADLGYGPVEITENGIKIIGIGNRPKLNFSSQINIYSSNIYIENIEAGQDIYLMNNANATVKNIKAIAFRSEDRLKNQLNLEGDSIIGDIYQINLKIAPSATLTADNLNECGGTIDGFVKADTVTAVSDNLIILNGVAEITRTINNTNIYGTLKITTDSSSFIRDLRFYAGSKFYYSGPATKYITAQSGAIFYLDLSDNPALNGEWKAVKDTPDREINLGITEKFKLYFTRIGDYNKE